MNNNSKQVLGGRLVEIRQEIKELKKRRKEINKDYVPNVKNPLMGYVALFGPRALRGLPKRKEPGEAYYRELFFKDIKFKSKLSRINKKISFLEGEYQKILAQIK